MSSHALVVGAASETSPDIVVHPLVLVSASDHGTRAALRKQTPVFGAILGQNNGKEVSLEISFECGVSTLGFANGAPVLEKEWFSDMIQHHVETHPNLSLVGWYTFGSEPQPWHSAVQGQLISDFECDSPAFLLVHDKQLTDSFDSDSGKLPFTIYETFIPYIKGGEDKREAGYPEKSQAFRYRPLTYTLDTSPDEAIALRDVVQQASIAVMPNTAPIKKQEPKVQQEETSPEAGSKGKEKATDKGKGKGKGKAKATATILDPTAAVLKATEEELNALSASEEEMIASLTAKANAIKMLKSRLEVITAFLKSQAPPHSPESYLTDASISKSSSTIKPADLDILRSAAALSSQLRLVTPSDLLTFDQESIKANTDVELITLLSTLTRGVSNVVVLGQKRVMMENGKKKKEPSKASEAVTMKFLEQLRSL